MSDIQPLSLILGAVLAVSTGIILYFLNQIYLFKNKVVWSDGLGSLAGMDRSYIAKSLEIEGRSVPLVASNVSFLLKVRAWSPVKGLVVHLDGLVDELEIYPEVPFKIHSEGSRSEISISSLNAGLYSLSAKRIGTTYGSISVKAVEATNAVTVKGDEEKRRFQPPSWWRYFVKPQLVLWICILAVVGVVGLVSHAQNSTEKQTTLDGKAKSQ